MTLLSAEVVGGDATAAVRAAAVVELVHNFSLVHDDIIDGDAIRRHRPTAWAAFGVPSATLVGDALLVLAIDVLAATDSFDTGPAVRCLGQALSDLLAGQAADMEFEQRDEVGADEYLSMAEGKTSALLGCACALGAMSGGADPATVARLQQFGRHSGLAFR
ncbi:polyprenyl synthetase family protein [Lentzea xinjiangensis]|uniref:polyprenyl synthetase family protein n=1 Tax=Lentzea xinjiangensis TaxID=402600 RepID=UPI001FE5512C|nr:polyprenyl synthetase family protein [Lentzea xinjiangensis]